MRARSALAVGFLALALSASGVGGPSAARAAQVACDNLVADDAGALGPGLAAVTEAAEGLVRAGADVRVHTLRRFDTPTLDIYESTIRPQCPSWLAEDGSRKNNLVVVMVAVENRKTGIYFGAQWERALSGRWTAVQTDVMNPRFRTGDFAGGIAAGLQELTRLISAESRATPPTALARPGVQDPAPTVAPLPPGPASPSPPPDYRWLSRVLAGILVAIGIWLLVRVAARARHRRRQRREAQQRAITQSEQVGSAFYSLSDRWSRVEPAAEVMIDGLHREASEPLRVQRDATSALVETSTGAFLAHEEAVADPSDKLDIDQYAAVEKACSAMLTELTATEQSVSALDEELSRLARLSDELPSRLEVVRARRNEIELAATAATQSGFTVAPARALLSRADDALAEVTAALAARHPDRANKSVLSATELVDSAATWVERLPLRQAELEAEIQALDARILQAQKALAEGREAFAVLSSRYAESGWESIRGNGTESEKRLARSLTVVEKCRSRITMERQEWDEVEADLAQVRQWLAEADSFIHSVVERKRNLEEAERHAPGELDNARAGAEEAAAFIAEHDADVAEELEEALRRASEEIDAAAADLGRSKPDYLVALRRLRAAQDKVDEILVDARSEHDQAERLRKSAAGHLREAKAAVSRASEYLSDHHRDLKGATEDLLTKAEELLERAEGTSDLNERITVAGAAEEAADDAYASAREDVAEAEGERDRGGLFSMSSSGGGFGSWGSGSGGSSWGGSSWGGGSSRSSGGGGSSSWGGSSSGGGGSSSFGSSSGGGGGSTGW